MEERICPVCYKVFYVEKDSTVVRCSFCDNIVFDARSAKRTAQNMDFFMVVGNRRIKVRLRDYSKDGLGIDLKSMPLNSDSVLRVVIKELNINRKARAVWIKQRGSIMSCGLKMV